jgi:hypothetical protein
MRQVLAKATRLLAHERYQTAASMLAALNGVDVPTFEESTLITENKDHADFDTRLNDSGPRNRRTKLRVVYGVLAIVGLVLVSSAAALLYTRQKSTPPTNARTTDAQTAEFEITRTNDLFTTVRAAPRTSSPELGKLYPDTRIVCQTTTVKGETLWSNNDWRYCPSVGGYIHSTLLRPTER